MPAGPPAFDPQPSTAGRLFLVGTPAAGKGAMSLQRVRGVIFALASLTIAIVVGCDLPVHPRNGSDVVQVRVAPESVALDPNQTQPFVASGRTAAGDSVPIDVTWAASAGSITAEGVYTADTSPTPAATAAAPAAAAATTAAAGGARLHRDRREHRLFGRHRQLVDAVPEQSRAAIRAGHAVLRQHASVDRQLFHAGDGSDH